MVFEENEFPSFPYSRKLKVQIVVLEFQIDAIIYFGIIFSRSLSQRLQKRVGVFLNSITFKSYRTFCERTEMAFNARFRIFEFSDTFTLSSIFSLIWSSGHLVTPSGNCFFYIPFSRQIFTTFHVFLFFSKILLESLFHGENENLKLGAYTVTLK